MSERIAAIGRQRARSRTRGPRRPLNSVKTEPAIRGVADIEGLQIRTTLIDDGVCVALSGDLTAATETRLAEYLDDAFDDYSGPIVVDLSELRTLEPVTVSTLLIAHRRASDDHRDLMLVRGSVVVQQVIDHVDGPFRYAR
jgi:anti-anti-sigma factor